MRKAWEIAERLFWTIPPGETDRRSTDPLGLDSMREQLADRLVPALTSRVNRHEDFYWTLVFVRWAAGQDDEPRRERRFLELERLLKLCWARFEGERGFSGVRLARDQARSRSVPVDYAPLLKTPRAQGLLGAHLRPLRTLGLVEPGALQLTSAGSALVAGAGDDLQFGRREGWDSLRRTFEKVRRPLPAFSAKLRERLRDHMPDLHRALQSTGWSTESNWKDAARQIGAGLRPYAILAAGFCPWADSLRSRFDAVVVSRGAVSEPPPRCPALLIPHDLRAFEPLAPLMRDWPGDGQEAIAALARLHEHVMFVRSYGPGDLWIFVEDGQFVCRPHLASPRGIEEGSDCRWRNAVRLMGPGKAER